MQTESITAVYLFGESDVIPYDNALAVNDYCRSRKFIKRITFCKVELGLHFRNEFMEIFLRCRKKHQISQSRKCGNAQQRPEFHFINLCN